MRPFEDVDRNVATQSSRFQLWQKLLVEYGQVEKNDGLTVVRGGVAADGSAAQFCVCSLRRWRRCCYVRASEPGKVCSEFEVGSAESYLNQETQEQLSNINLDALMDAARLASGTLVDITSADGDVVNHNLSVI